MSSLESDKTIKVPVIEVVQPLGVLYIASMNYKDLIYISHADVRRLDSETGQREVEDYIGIQRPLSPKRVKEIAEYVNLYDAAFPTSVILHIDEENVKYKKESHIMEIKKDIKVAKVIDGQHRIEGLREGSPLENDDFDVNVTLLIGMALEDQALVFATINKEQTKVNKSLVADLYSLAKDRSPQRTAHVIVRTLHKKEGSAFYGKIKILGVSEDSEKETITQATFFDAILKYISGSKIEAMRDRDVYKRGKKLEKVSGDVLEKRFLRNMFIDGRDSDIAQLLNNYFEAVSLKWPTAWNEVRPEYILNRSTGFGALMRFFKDAYLSFDDIGRLVTTEEFSKIFEGINIPEESLTKEIYSPGGGGPAKLYKELV